MPRPPRQPKRRSKYPPILHITVFTEGRKTEPAYLTHWRREKRDSVRVHIDPKPGAPTTIVDRVIKRKNDDIRQERRGHGRASDEYWCVMDVDEHPNLHEVLSKARDNEICVAVSNPCIELWFILHFRDQTAHIERTSAQDISARLLEAGKNLNQPTLRKLVDKFDVAKARAKSLDQKHLNDGRAEGSNPSSSMWRLIDRITEGNQN